MHKYQVSTEDRMFCYLWWETTNPNECKFGERWVPAGKNPEDEVYSRVKASLDVRKDLLKDGIVQIEEIWDVTDLAKKVGRYHKSSRMDDYIRSDIGFRKGNTGEIHTRPAVDFAHRVNEYLKKKGQPLPVVGLSQHQVWKAEDVLNAVQNGRRTIVAELCARFGKTIWSGALIRETNAQLTIVASYVLTSFASFKKDLSSFEQFRDLVLIDSADEGWEDDLDTALHSGLQVVVFLSMCNGERRQDKIDRLFGADLADYDRLVRRLVLVDEADFGVHRTGQAQSLIDARGEQDVVILMTGTNGDRAAGAWQVDHYFSVTYPELLMDKHQERLTA